MWRHRLPILIFFFFFTDVLVYTQCVLGQYALRSTEVSHIEYMYRIHPNFTEMPYSIKSCFFKIALKCNSTVRSRNIHHRFLKKNEPVEKVVHSLWSKISILMSYCFSNKNIQWQKLTTEAPCNHDLWPRVVMYPVCRPCHISWVSGAERQGHREKQSLSCICHKHRRCTRLKSMCGKYTEAHSMSLCEQLY